MIKYKIIQEGIDQLVIYEYNISNNSSLEEKVLSVLDKTVWQPPSAIYQSIRNDKTLKTNSLTLGSVSSMLTGLETKGFVTSYDELMDKPMGGDLNANSIK